MSVIRPNTLKTDGNGAVRVLIADQVVEHLGSRATIHIITSIDCFNDCNFLIVYGINFV